MKKTKKFILLTLFAVTLLSNISFAESETTINSSEEEKTYVDLDNSHWAKDYLERWSDEGIITGYEDGTIRPDDCITRAELATMLSRIFALTQKADLSQYTDIDEEDWYYDSLAEMANLGVIKGKTDTEIMPNDLISRQETMTIFKRLFILSSSNSSTQLEKYADSEFIASWAIESVGAMTESEYICGYEDGSIKPEANITRAEISKVLDNVVSNIISTPGTYELGEVDANVIVKSNGVSIKNTTLKKGMIYLSEGVSDVQVDSEELKDKIITVDDIVKINSEEIQTEENESSNDNKSNYLQFCTINVISEDSYYQFRKSGIANTIKSDVSLTIKLNDETVVDSFLVNESNLKEKLLELIDSGKLDENLIRGTVVRFKDNATVKRLGLKILSDYQDPEEVYENLPNKELSAMERLAQKAIANLTYSELLELANAVCEQ